MKDWTKTLLIAGAIFVAACCVAGAILFVVYWPAAQVVAPPTAPATAPTTAGGLYDVYFTTPKYPDRESDHRGSLDEKLTAFVNTAQSSVDMAIYQLDLPNVIQALLNAKQRGATVRLVTDVDILNDPDENASFKQLQNAGIPVVAGNPNAIMHNKFVVVDRAAIWTGSWNFTVNDAYRYNNNGILIRSPGLANNYTITFEKMFNDKKFGGPRKPGGTTPRLTIGNIPAENYFAPEDDVAKKIIARIAQAKQSIDFMAYSFTDDGIGSAMRDRAKAGVRVRGVFEKTGSETQFSEYGPMRKQGMDVWQDGNPYLMHHKVFILDDKTVILGSYNFSRSADEDNDENLLMLDDPSLAQSFKSEFMRVYEQAKAPPTK
jgi:phosphatidylserine/phosphatidylglycerophosphate/cardiolipin synthase-like enzyme